MSGGAERIIKQAEIGPLDENRMASFVASTNRIDRYGDIIEQEWDLADFWRNPVFLWSHNSWGMPIGWVREFEADRDRTETVARVQFAPEGHDEFVDQLARAVNIRLIRAVSVGFVPIEMEDRLDERGRWDGYRFMRNQLIELSLCTVPANPDALGLAKSINSSPKFLRRLFADGVFRAGLPGLDAHSAPKPVGTFTMRDRALADLARIKSLEPPGVSGRT
jgi:HK97 family phage prohead protease